MENMDNSIGSLREKIAALRTQREWIPASNTAAIRATNHEIERLEKQITKLESLDGGRVKKWFGPNDKNQPISSKKVTRGLDKKWVVCL